MKFRAGAACAALTVGMLLLPATSALADTCIGICGTAGADGVVTAPPSGAGSYRWISISGGSSSFKGLGVGGETNGSLFTTSTFASAAGDPLNFYFNYVTSDGAGFADYAYAQLLSDTDAVIATLFSARTQPAGNGNVVPGFGLPGHLATLTPATTPITAGGPTWSPLGSSSGQCFDDGCGYTGWIGSTYTISDAGLYKLAFGVVNWDDTAFDTGLAIDGITINNVPIDPTGGIPEPTTWAMMILGFGLVGSSPRRRRLSLAAARPTHSGPASGTGDCDERSRCH